MMATSLTYMVCVFASCSLHCRTHNQRKLFHMAKDCQYVVFKMPSIMMWLIFIYKRKGIQLWEAITHGVVTFTRSNRQAVTSANWFCGDMTCSISGGLVSLVFVPPTYSENAVNGSGVWTQMPCFKEQIFSSNPKSSKY